MVKTKIKTHPKEKIKKQEKQYTANGRNQNNKMNNTFYAIKQSIKESFDILKHATKDKETLKKMLFTSSAEARKAEFKRKCFHFFGLGFSFAIVLLPQKIAILTAMTILVPLLIADYNNLLSWLKKLPRGDIFINLLREHELVHGQLCGLSWIFIGALAVVTLFDKYLASMAMAVLIFGDAFAALIGKNFGHIKLCGKTLEGSIAFVVFGTLIIFFYQYYILPQIGLGLLFNTKFLFCAVVMSAITELVAKQILIDDNFAIPLMFCLTYRILTIII